MTRAQDRPSQTRSPRSSFLLGVRDIAPVLLGIAPFGLVSGVAALSVGIPTWPAFAMSFIVFAGSSQIAAVQLMGLSTPIGIILLSTTLINLRMMMYSASLAPYFRHLSGGWKLLVSYLLVDQAYAFSLMRFGRGEALSKRWYYLGVGLSCWFVWVGASALGVFVGAKLPEGLGLEFTIPLSFLALLVPVLSDRPSVAAALAGGAVAVAAYGLPNNLGLILGALSGVGAGVLLEARKG